MNQALIRFWAALSYQNEIGNSNEQEVAEGIAFNILEYHPIDTRFCMVRNIHEDIWYLYEASGSAIIKVTPASHMNGTFLSNVK